MRPTCRIGASTRRPRSFGLAISARTALGHLDSLLVSFSPIHYFPHLLKPPARSAQSPLRPRRRLAPPRLSQAQFHLFLLGCIYCFHIFLSQSSQSHMDIRRPCEIFLKNIFQAKKLQKPEQSRTFRPGYACLGPTSAKADPGHARSLSSKQVHTAL